MVDGTTQLASPAIAPSTTSEEDEVLKRNTDCVYFLASPLTCKKGSECEYRHSDVARVNPRDCYYWLNGNCLNPKCAFRHPPLDGLLGSDVSTPVGPIVPAPHATSYAMPKQGVPCIFFQKGYCLKGHLCPFLHGPRTSVTNKPLQSGPTNSVSEPPKTANSGPVKPIYEPKFTQPTTQKPTHFLNGGNGKKIAPPSSIEEPSRNKLASVVPPAVVNEFKPNRNVNHGYHVSKNDRIVNVKDADEYSREPSPGFDVLVDNEAEDGEYFREKDEFGPDIDRGTYSQHRDYDRYDERDGQYVFEEGDRDQRPYRRRDDPDQFNGSDLRNRLSKQQRSVVDHGLRSVVSRENGIDRANQRYDHHPNQGTLSSRLKGRVKMPGRSISPTNRKYPRVEMEFDMDRKVRSRYSPGRPLSVNQSRIGDRVKTDTKFTGPKRLSELKSVRPNDENFSGKRNYSKMEEDLSFEGPKPLSEILKRKRGVNENNDNDNNNNNNNNHISFVDTKENNQKEKEEHKFVKADREVENEKGNNDSAVNYGASEVEIEGGLNDEDALVGEELEGEYEYEQMDGEEGYELDEDEYVDEGEYVDEEEDVINENVVYS